MMDEKNPIHNDSNGMDEQDSRTPPNSVDEADRVHTEAVDKLWMMDEKNPIHNDSNGMDEQDSRTPPNSVDEADRVHTEAVDKLQKDGSTVVSIASVLPEQQDRPSSLSCYFNDDKRRIDFILVYADGALTKSKWHKVKQATGKVKDISKMRDTFMTNLKAAGLEIEKNEVQTEKKTIYYLKLHAPWEVLCLYAENLSMKAPIKTKPSPHWNWTEDVLSSLKIPNIMTDDVPDKPQAFYMCHFMKSKLDRFINSDNPESFFSNKDRQRIMYEILETTNCGKRENGEIGIKYLLDQKVFKGAFPLHEGPYQKPISPQHMNPRQVLYEYWARWGKWYKYQPLDHIRDYFGEQIGLYFAWLGFYTVWLVPAALVGLFVFLYGFITMWDNDVAKETCNSGNDLKMCPLCEEDDGCPYWYLSSICIYTRISYLFDNSGTVFYAVFSSFWAVTFLEYWKRTSITICQRWDCMDFEEEVQTIRPAYTVIASTHENNPITGATEPFIPYRLRMPRIIGGTAVISVMITIVIIFIVGVVQYRVLIGHLLFRSSLSGEADTIASFSAALVNLIIIMLLGTIYKKLALNLTQWEMHRTQTDFDDNLILKVFIFQFINCYSSIVYVSFFKGRLVGYPGNYNTVFGLRREECQNGGCLIELAMLSGMIMIGKQAISNIKELLIPKIKTYLHRRKALGHSLKTAATESRKVKSRWEEDFELIESEGLLDEYLEMVLQFGFITIFVAAFPLAPLFALFNNWLEIRLDALKFVCETRRPVAERCQDIGIWFNLMDIMAQLAVISNAFIIAFTSEFLPKLVYQYGVSVDESLKGYVNFTLAWAPNGTLTEPCRYQQFRDNNGNYTFFFWKLLVIQLLFVIIFEHVVFGICRLIDVLVPDIPRNVEITIKREHYLGKQAFRDKVA